MSIYIIAKGTVLRMKNKQAASTCRHDVWTKQKIVAAEGIRDKLRNRDQHLNVSSHSSLHSSARLHLKHIEQENLMRADRGCGAERKLDRGIYSKN